jgi:hypothetical protein
MCRYASGQETGDDNLPFPLVNDSEICCSLLVDFIESFYIFISLEAFPIDCKFKDRDKILNLLHSSFSTLCLQSEGNSSELV